MPWKYINKYKRARFRVINFELGRIGVWLVFNISRLGLESGALVFFDGLLKYVYWGYILTYMLFWIALIYLYQTAGCRIPQRCTYALAHALLVICLVCGVELYFTTVSVRWCSPLLVLKYSGEGWYRNIMRTLATYPVTRGRYWHSLLLWVILSFQL